MRRYSRLVTVLVVVTVALAAAVFLWVACWEPDDRDCQHIQAHQAPAYKVRYLSDGTTVVTGGDDGRLALWDARSGAMIQEFASGAKQISTMDAAQSGDLVAAAFLFANGDTYAWYGHGLQEVGRISEEVAYPLSVSPDGKLIAICKGTALRLWDVAAQREVRRFGKPDHLYTCMRFSPDGVRLITGGRDDMVRSWDVATGCEVRQFGPAVGHPWALAVSPDSGLICSGHDDGQVLVWRHATGELVTAFYADEFVTGLDYSPDGRYLASCGYDGVVRLWDTQTWKKVASRRIRGGGKATKRILHGIAFAPDSRSVATVDAQGQLVVWPLSLK